VYNSWNSIHPSASRAAIRFGLVFLALNVIGAFGLVAIAMAGAAGILGKHLLAALLSQVMRCNIVVLLRATPTPCCWTAGGSFPGDLPCHASPEWRVAGLSVSNASAKIP
jgi:hypothetical protein